ncbi:MAG: twin-arginine translocase TatA/TatE family subunit [Bacteroidia bacterium]|nr:twin-arginine translocase TatA/TatE family subunit [Bacteroidia bacterium]
MIIVFINKAFFLFINLSGSELFIILAVAFLIFGPKKLPELGRKAGHFLNDLKKTTKDITREFENEAQPVKSEFNKLKHEIRSVNEKASLKKEASDNKKEKK